MNVFIALLRAINVGGTGKLAMSELRSLCEEQGFSNCRTYIQSGNALFTSGLAEAAVKSKLERALARKLGKPSAVLVRTRSELASIARRNPWKSAAANRVVVWFLDQAPARDALASVRPPGREQLHAEGREVFVHYPDGMGRSKLKLPFAVSATARNINTVQKLAALAAELEHN